MRKLIGVLSATALITSSTSAVISCGNDAWWKEFNTAVKNKETFLVYIGADDCEYCNQFEEAKTATGDLVQTQLEKMKTDYAALLTSLGTNKVVDDLTGFGQDLLKPDSVKLHEYVIEKKADNFTEKWSKNILNWIRDQLREIYYQKTFANLVSQGSINELTARNQTKDSVKNYLDTSKGTPMFLMVRNGQFAGISVGFNQSSSKNHEEDIKEWFKPLSDYFLADDFSQQMVEIIDKNQAATESSLTTYNYNDINLLNYL